MRIAETRKSELEGRLQHRGPQNGTFRESPFRERFFKLIGNLLFYYRISELSQIENEPMGVIILENYSVRPDASSNLPFAFEITFHDEPEKHHIFTTRTEGDMNHWIKTLETSGYQYWKGRYDALSTKLNNALRIQNEPPISAKDPTGHHQTQKSQAFAPKRQAAYAKVQSKTAEDDLIKF